MVFKGHCLCADFLRTFNKGRYNHILEPVAVNLLLQQFFLCRSQFVYKFFIFQKLFPEVGVNLPDEGFIGIQQFEAQPPAV